MQKDPPKYSIQLVFHPEEDEDFVHFENSSANPFDANPAGFPRVNAWWLAESALTTYWSEPDAKGIFSGAGLQSKFIKAGSTDCYLAWQNTFVIVAFRGTEPDEWDDILTDIQLQLVPWKAGRVHRGFKHAVDEIWPALQSELDPLAASRTVWFCGHSLGAALATLAAHKYGRTRGVCTMGCPRVGDASFAAAFNADLSGNTLRYVNHHDIVTHVPTPLFGYRHVAVGRFIAANGTVSGSPPLLQHFFDELFGSPEVLLETIHGLQSGALTIPSNALLDHMPKAYAIWTWNDYDANG